MASRPVCADRLYNRGRRDDAPRYPSLPKEQFVTTDAKPDQIQLMGARPKPKPRVPRTRRRANDLDGATWLKNSISVWDDIRKTTEESRLGHPAMFPSQLVTRLIESFTTNDQRLILDPFVGVGSTVIAAESLGKIGVGLDISEEFIKIAEERPRRLVKNGESYGERSLHVASAFDVLEYVRPETIDMVVTSPPYWDILLRDRTADYKETRHYGESAIDLGRIRNYGKFLDTLAAIFGRVLMTMKPGAYCCIVVMDIRKRDKFYPFHSDLAKKLTDVGFLLDDIIIWMRNHEYNNLRPLGHPSVFRVNKVHEYINIFQKPR